MRFEVTEQTRQAIDDYLRVANRKQGQFLFAAQREPGLGLSTRQYARLVGYWIRSIGLDPCMFGTHSLRRTKATLIYRRTGNLRAVQLLLGQSRAQSAILVSRLTTLWRLPSKPTFDADRTAGQFCPVSVCGFMRPAYLASTASLTIPPRRVRYERSFCPARHKPAGQLLTLLVTSPPANAALRKDHSPLVLGARRQLRSLVGRSTARPFQTWRSRSISCAGGHTRPLPLC